MYSKFLKNLPSKICGPKNTEEIEQFTALSKEEYSLKNKKQKKMPLIILLYNKIQQNN